MSSVLAALLLQAAAPSAPLPPIAPADAIGHFRRLCVASMPDPRRFDATLDLEQAGWTAFEKKDGEVTILGRFWRSDQGELSYVNLPEANFLETNPACHFSFGTAGDYSHDQAAQMLAGALSLDSGKQTGRKRAPQTRWESRLPDGTRVRIFLSSAVFGTDEPAATLSISAYRPSRRGR